MLQTIKENKKLLAIFTVIFLLFTAFANAQVSKHNEVKEKLLKEIAEEKYQKDLVQALYGQRQDFIDDKEEIDVMIENLLKSKAKKDEEIEKVEHIIRCEKDNTFKEPNEQDDCKTNWRNYPL